MTDEQIKQNAEEYAKKIYPYTVGKAAAIRDFIAGAHSSDEEIRDLETKNSALQTAYEAETDVLENKIIELRAIINKLRNPWISVEEWLPEEHSKVLIMFCNGTVTYNDYIGVGDINYMKAHSKTITHWMPIPETPF